jgi:hypothetical protein
MVTITSSVYVEYIVESRISASLHLNLKGGCGNVANVDWLVKRIHMHYPGELGSKNEFYVPRGRFRLQELNFKVNHFKTARKRMHWRRARQSKIVISNKGYPSTETGR